MPAALWPPGPMVTESAVWERVGGDPMAMLSSPGDEPRLRAVYDEYAAVARRHGLPILLCAPTWRANRERAQPGANARALRFISELTPWHAALMGPRGDCYTPGAALDRAAARSFHEWQAGELSGARLVMLATFPAVSEALGILDVLRSPAVVSFVLTVSGALLDGTPLEQAMAEVDEAAERPPVGYWINCTHAGTALAGLRRASARGELRRLLGIQANASPLDTRDFAQARDFANEAPELFAESLPALRREFGLRVLGGCCGTRASHLEALATRLRQPPG